MQQAIAELKAKEFAILVRASGARFINEKEAA
jgi:hypothetical protein